MKILDRNRTGIAIVGCAAVMGVAADVLLRSIPLGLNAFVFVSTFAAALVVLAIRFRPELATAANISIVAAMVFFASMFALRDSTELKVFDGMAIVSLMGAAMLTNLGLSPKISGAVHYAAGIVWSGLTSAFGGILLLGADIEWRSTSEGRAKHAVFSVLRGAAIVLPLLLIFGGLFVAADAAFEGLVARVFNFDLSIIIGHVVMASIFAWLSAGYFRGAVMPFWPRTKPSVRPIPTAAEDKKDDQQAADAEENVGLPNFATVVEHMNRPDPPDAGRSKPESSDRQETQRSVGRDWQNIDNTILPQVFTLGTIETVMILGLLDLLFLGFVIVQIPYLFGGFDLIQNTPDYTLATYARRGFGELVAVAMLVPPVLLTGDWLLRKGAGRVVGVFRILAGIQIALLFVIMASAVQRIVLITGESGYGMTTVRFYPLVVMIWLAIVFVWFAMTVLRGARKHFAWGALWAAVAILGATNIFNPDAFIAKTNIDLMKRGRTFDAGYNASLSADAIPVLLGSISEMNDQDQCIARMILSASRSSRDGQLTEDIRSWSLSRYQARDLLLDNIRINDDEIFKQKCSRLLSEKTIVY